MNTHINLVCLKTNDHLLALEHRLVKETDIIVVRHLINQTGLL